MEIAKNSNISILSITQQCRRSSEKHYWKTPWSFHFSLHFVLCLIWKILLAKAQLHFVFSQMNDNT